MSIKGNIKKIKARVGKGITIVAATKKRSICEIKEALESGIKIIGENYVQEARKKYLSLKDRPHIHCIGYLQKNKVKKAVEIFDMIQTIDSKEIAQEINKRCREISKVMPVLIEVNIANEQNKHGCLPENIAGLASFISELENIKLKGIMVMGPNLEAEKLRGCFREAKNIFDNLKKQYPEMDVLSMGMSDSFKIAIEEGATMIRLGTAIFGPR